MAKNFKSIDEYLFALPAEKRQVLEELRLLIKGILPTSKEVITYQMPAYKLNQIIIWFASCKGHFSIYMKPKFYIGFEDERLKYNGTKSAIHFDWNKEIPKAFINKLILIF